jgi:xylan 1,4-beta-xylosidase
MKGLMELAADAHVNLAGVLTWAFEFEGQPLFAGRRSLASHGIDKPEMNLFRMAGMLSGERVGATSDAAIPADSVVKAGVRERPEVDALATRAGKSASVMVWNYADDDVAGVAATVRMTVNGVPVAVRRVRVEEFRIDAKHSNAFEAWKQMGSPQDPNAEQVARLKAAGQLERMGSPRWVTVEHGKAQVEIELPRESVSLLRVGWGK